jgi:hypothetical protein
MSCSSLGTEYSSRDLLSEIATDDDTRIDAAGVRYAHRFALSDEQGFQLARMIRDYSAIRNRSESDMADFAKRLYGVDPAEIVSAVAAAQLGERENLNALITDAARHFGTTPEIMKTIARDLHG